MYPISCYLFLNSMLFYAKNLYIINKNIISVQICSLENLKCDLNVNMKPNINDSKRIKYRENTSVIQTCMEFYANLYQVTIFYTNLRKVMLNLKSYVFLFFCTIMEG